MEGGAPALALKSGTLLVMDPLRCPECDAVGEIGTCPQCGLWWIGRDARFHRLAPAEPGKRLETVDLPLRSRLSLMVVLFAGAGAILGFGAALAALLNLFEAPSSVRAWVQAAIGLSLGGWVGTGSVVLVVSVFLHACSPSRLVGERDALNIRVWNTWQGTFERLKRVRRSIPREHIEGVGWTTGQGGQSQLFIVHSSGKCFATGWDGTAEEAERLSQPLLQWIAASDAKVQANEQA